MQSWKVPLLLSKKASILKILLVPKHLTRPGIHKYEHKHKESSILPTEMWVRWMSHGYSYQSGMPRKTTPGIQPMPHLHPSDMDQWYHWSIRFLTNFWMQRNCTKWIALAAPDVTIQMRSKNMEMSTVETLLWIWSFLIPLSPLRDMVWWGNLPPPQMGWLD